MEIMKPEVNEHPDDLELGVYIACRDSKDEYENRRIAGRLKKIEAHLRECEECRDTVAKSLATLAERWGEVIEKPKKNERVTVNCPQCHKAFALRFARDFEENEAPPTLVIRDCPSGGIYDVHIECPHCNYEEPL